MKTDILLLERDCPHCGVIKAILNMDAATDDDFRGKDGQEFLVIASMSNRGSIELAKAFGHPGKTIPLLICEGGAITDDNEIKAYLEKQGMTS